MRIYSSVGTCCHGVAFKEQEYAGEEQLPIKLHIKQLAVPNVQLLAVTSAGDMQPNAGCWPPALESSSGFTNGTIAMYNEYVSDICSITCIHKCAQLGDTVTDQLAGRAAVWPDDKVGPVAYAPVQSE
jgi:hypothetical protein